MGNKKSLIIFCFAFILAFVYWRLKVFIKYMEGGVSYLRTMTGLTIHHYHTGLLILTIALLLYLFYKQNNIILAFIGFGLGTVLDSFMSRLFKANTRMEEILNYNFNFYNTLIFFGVVLVTGVIFYLINEKYKSKDLKNL